MFIAARGIIGFGLGFNITAAPILIMELAFPTQKAPMVSIYNSLWSLGAIVAAWTTYGTFRIMSNWAWRIPSILQALSSVIQIFCFWWIVESPRWLVSKDRCDEAQAIITRVSSFDFDMTSNSVNLGCSIMPTATQMIRSLWWN
jgi:MFS family permease